jgi:hypothetical protein
VPAGVPPFLKVASGGMPLAVTTDGRLWALPAHGTGTTPQPDRPPAGTRLVFAVSRPGGGSTSDLAVLRLGQGGVVLFVGNSRGLRPAFVPPGVFSPPTWVPQDGLLIARGGDPALTMVQTNGSARRIGAPGLPLADGVAHVLAVVGKVGRRQLWIGRLARSSTGGSPGQVVRADGWEPIGGQFADVADAAWSGDLELTVLTGGGRDAGRLWRWKLSSALVLEALPTTGLPVAADTMTDASGQQPLVTARGRVWRLDGSRWTDVADGTSVRYPS